MTDDFATTWLGSKTQHNDCIDLINKVHEYYSFMNPGESYDSRTNPPFWGSDVQLRVKLLQQRDNALKIKSPVKTQQIGSAKTIEDNDWRTPEYYAKRQFSEKNKQ